MAKAVYMHTPNHIVRNLSAIQLNGVNGGTEASTKSDSAHYNALIDIEYVLRKHIFSTFAHSA